MKSKDIFGLVVRILGLVFLYHGLAASPRVIPLILSRNITNTVIGVLLVVLPLVVAWWLIGGASLLMRRAYPDAGKNETVVAEKADEDHPLSPRL